MTPTVRRSVGVLALLAAAVTTLVPAPTIAQEEDDARLRQRLADYLLLYYVDRPNDESEAYRPQLLDGDAIVRGEEEGGFWLDSDVPQLHEIVRSLLGPPGDATTARFQRYVAALLDVRGKRVAVYLIDDLGQVLQDGGANARRRYGASIDQSEKRVWPSARTRREGALAGSFSTGAYNLESLADARSTFLHELTHIQTATDMRSHLFRVRARDWNFRYGKDGTHYLTEVLPDLTSAYSEGLAGAVQLLFEPDLARTAFERFGPDDRLYVEAARPSRAKYGSGRHPDIWLYDQIVDAGIPHRILDRNCADDDSCYVSVRIGDLPARFLVHNERVLSMVVAEYAGRHLGLTGFLRAVRRANASLESERATWTGAASRLTISGIAHLFDALCREGAEGRDIALDVSPPADEAIPYLLPLALLDYFTGRSAESKNAFAELFQGQLPGELLTAYWEAGRPRLDGLLPSASGPGAHSYGDLDRIADAFGVASTPSP